MNTTATATESSATHRTIWRWHFYAGLICMPFILWLSVTGAIYLFKPQFESWRDQPYAAVASSPERAADSAQVDAALTAVPGSTLKAFELAPTPAGASRIVLTRDGHEVLAYVHPQTLQVLKVQNSDDRLMQVVHELHGNLLLGDRGSIVVELAASWAIVMIISGLYLWWPRNARGLAGVAYPRLRAGGRVFWRDLHAVIGLWISLFALFLLISGLPWTHFWGDNLKSLRQLGSKAVVQQDWTTSSVKTAPAVVEDEHAEHHAHHQGHHAYISPYVALDRLVATVAPLNLAPPVRIFPPSQKSPGWTAQSLSQDRRQRVNLVLDAQSGAVLERKNFSDRKLLDRIIGIGISIHEGQMFGWLNQLLGVLTALGLVTLVASGFVMWWKRKPVGALGALRPLPGSSVPLRLWVLAGIFGVLLPLFGLSMVIVLLTERMLLRRIPRMRSFLGLQSDISQQRHTLSA